MPAYPSKKDRPALRRAGRLAALWGWSYILTIFAFFFLDDVKAVPVVYHWILFTSILFVLVGVAELYWRHRLLSTGQARWARVLALNQCVGTLALIWCAAWLHTIDVHDLEKLLSPESLKQVRAIGTTMGRPITPQLIDLSMGISKNITVFGIGGLLFLAQIWITCHYLRIAPVIEREATIPPVLR
jgi:hypothetical protein